MSLHLSLSLSPGLEVICILPSIAGLLSELGLEGLCFLCSLRIARLHRTGTVRRTRVLPRNVGLTGGLRRHRNGRWSERSKREGGTGVPPIHPSPRVSHFSSLGLVLFFESGTPPGPPKYTVLSCFFSPKHMIYMIVYRSYSKMLCCMLTT